MPNQNPNETQAVNLLRRLRADPLRREAEKAAKNLIGKLQGVAMGLTVQGVMRAAIARHPDAGVFAAIERMTQQVDDSQAADEQMQQIFDVAEALEEQRFAPLDAACKKRVEEIGDLLGEAQRDYRSKIMNQEAPEKRWKSYVDRGLTTDEIKKLGIPEPVYGRDLVAERNQWGFELEQTTQPLITARDAIIRVKYTRNETALPGSVLALVEGEKS